MNSTNAQVSQQFLDQGWFVLPWEEFCRLKNTQDILTIDFLFNIKKKLPVRMNDYCVEKAIYESKSSFYTKFKYKGFTPTVSLMEELVETTDYKFLLKRSIDAFLAERHDSFVPSDFFWIFLKKNPDQPELIELFDVSVPHDYFSDSCICCTIMVCLGLCTVACCVCR